MAVNLSFKRLSVSLTVKQDHVCSRWSAEKNIQIPVIRRGRDRIERREKWPKKVGRREKQGEKVGRREN